MTKSWFTFTDYSKETKNVFQVKLGELYLLLKYYVVLISNHKDKSRVLCQVLITGLILHVLHDKVIKIN